VPLQPKDTIPLLTALLEAKVALNCTSHLELRELEVVHRHVSHMHAVVQNVHAKAKLAADGFNNKKGRGSRSSERQIQAGWYMSRHTHS
jgi:hypothetical protein